MSQNPSPLPARPVAFSAVREQVYMVFPNDLNANDTVFGGLIMAQMDRFAAVVADRHAAGVCVTASVDAVHFVAPARRGDVLIFNASVNRAWTSSMEVGVKIGREDVAAVQTETEDENRRWCEAQLRRENRLQHAEKIRVLRGGK